MGFHRRVFTAASTASTWPGTLTLRHTLWITPLASTRNVDRCIPIYFLPYKVFSPQTPKSWAVFTSGSEASGILSLYLALNLSWLAVVSLETPITGTPKEANFFALSENPMASLVQPAVSSFG